MREIIKSFYLDRGEDESAVSGTGVVAVGVVLPSGKVVMEWLTFHTSLAIYNNLEDVEKIHGHSGATRVIMGTPKEKGKKK